MLNGSITNTHNFAPRSSVARSTLGRMEMLMADFTIFLIDDDSRVLKALTRLLQNSGYRTKAYYSSEIFLGEHDASIPGCAVLDLSMSGLSGLDVQQALTLQGVDRPIIFLAGRGTIRTTIQAMKAGAVDVLLKPIDRRELLQAVKRAREEDKMRRQIDVRRFVLYSRSLRRAKERF